MMIPALQNIVAHWGYFDLTGFSALCYIPGSWVFQARASSCVRRQTVCKSKPGGRTADKAKIAICQWQGRI
jgi:hypothetical protein